MICKLPPVPIRRIAALAVGAAGLIVGSATATADSEPPQDPGDDAAVVADARAGLAAWLANAPGSTGSSDLPGCPALDFDALTIGLDAVGLTAPFGDWDTTIESDPYEDLGVEGLEGIACVADTDGDSHDASIELSAGIVVVDVADESLVPNVLATLDSPPFEPEPADVPGGTVQSVCLTEDIAACASAWSSDGFVVMVVVASGTEDVALTESGTIPDGATRELITAVLPEILATLAAHADPEGSPSLPQQLGFDAGTYECLVESMSEAVPGLYDIPLANDEQALLVLQSCQGSLADLLEHVVAPDLGPR